MIRLSCWIGSMHGVIGSENMRGEGASPVVPVMEIFPLDTGLQASPDESGGRCQCPFANVAHKLARFFDLEDRHGRRH